MTVGELYGPYKLHYHYSKDDLAIQKKITLQYTRGYKAGIKSVHRPADLGRSIHKYSCG